MTRPYLRTLVLTAIIYLFLTPPAFAGPSLSDSVFDRLVALGYSSMVLENLRTHWPDMYQKMDGLSDAQLKPVTIYRGQSTTINDYDPRYISQYFKDKMYAAEQFSLPASYAFSDGLVRFIQKEDGSYERYAEKVETGIIIEFEIPVAFLEDKKNGVYIFSRESVPDDRIFMKRMGLVRQSEFINENKKNLDAHELEKKGKLIWFYESEVYADDLRFRDTFLNTVASFLTTAESGHHISCRRWLGPI